MNIYNQIVEPTKVTHSVACHFTSKTKKNLIVVKGTILQIFELQEQQDSTQCLSLIGTYKLHGQVVNIAAISTIESPGFQFLIVSTKFAKMSIITWNFELNTIETVSLHYYEPFFVNNSPITDLDTADMVLEPNNKFVCMIFNNLLAFLPLRADSKNVTTDSDFLEEEDDDVNMDSSNKKRSKKSNNFNSASSNAAANDEEDDEDKDAIYKPTFAVPANTFIPNIKDIITIKFLKNYRSATMAVLYTSSALSWAGNLKLNKDTVSFQIASLDFEKNEYSNVITLDNLPYDLYDIIPLQTPLSGCLLVGCNELILVDSSGSSQGVIVNQFTTDSTSYSNFSKDQSSLNLNLENCVITAVPKFPTRLLLVSESGIFYWVIFKLDGKNIRRFEIVETPSDNYKNINLEKISSVTVMNNEKIFVSCDSGDSLLLSMSDSLNSSETQTTAIPDAYDPDDDINYEDENQEESNDNDLQDFKILDKLTNCGPLTSLTLASLSTEKSLCGLQNPNYNDISFVGASGSGKNSAITAFSPSIKPKVKSTLKLNDVNRIWTLKCKSVYFTSKGVKLEKDYNYMVTTNFEKSASDIFSINDNFKNLSLKTGFRNKELIINIGFINDKQNIIQITKKNLYLYDLNFKLLKGIPLKEIQGTKYEDLLEIDLNGDEDQSTAEVQDLEEIVNGNIHSNFVMINTSKGSVNIIEFLPENLNPKKLKNRDKKNSDVKYFEQIDIPSMLTDVIITNGYISSSHLYGSVSSPKSIIRNISKFSNDSEKNINGSKRTFSLLQEQENYKTIEKNNDTNLPDLKNGIVFILVTGDNRVVVFRKEHKQRVFQLDRVDKMSENLNINLFNSSNAYPDPYIKQAILVNLGDKYVQKEYLVILTIGGETYFYELYYDKLNGVCKFRKQENMLVTGAPDNAFAWGTQIERRLIYVDDFANGLKCLFITGTIPFFVVKERHSTPRIYKFTKFPAITFAPFKLDTKDNKLSNNFFNFSDYGSNFIFLDTFRNGRICSIPYGNEDLDSPSVRMDYTNQLPIMKFPVGETIKFITYHETSQSFILSTFEEIDYKCIDEDGNIIAGSEENKPHARNYKGKLKLVSANHWKVIDEVHYEDNRVALQVKSMYLNTSSSSPEMISVKREKEVVLAGISNFRMEDLAALGSFHVYEIIDIIPEKDKPEFNHKFKEIFKESTKGAVTAVTDVSGRFLISQGQKVIVRDLQEDNTVVPVAFLDTSIYVSEAKSFGNLLLLGDVMKSMWFVGFDAEPYRMLMFSKDVIPVDINAGDFISYNSDLFFLLADNNENLHILQFNPEDPASLSGQRLVRKVTFNINTVTTCMRKFPKKNTLNHDNPDFQVVGANVDGSLYIVSPLSEPSYRRLYVLQQQIIDKENHHLGLNPRANRISEDYETINSQYTALSMHKVKTLIDGDLLNEFVYLNEDRKRSLAYKAGKQSYSGIWRDLVEHNLAII